MAEHGLESAGGAGEKRLAFFERYLSVWVALSMVVDMVLGKALPSAIAVLRGVEFGRGPD
jgi:ACR3 family arsenite transporter